MRKFVGVIAAMALLATAGAALAGGEVTGKVMENDGGVITLENGETFTVGEGMDTAAIEEGTVVKLSYDEEGDNKVVTAITPEPGREGAKVTE